MRAQILTVLVLLSATFLMSERAFACSCANVSKETRREWADIIFTGTVIKSEGSNFVFAVEEVLKGTSDKEIIVDAGSNGICTTSFSVGATYMVYVVSNSNKYSTNMCSGNRLLRDVRSPQTTESSQDKFRMYIVWAALAFGLILVVGFAAWVRFSKKAS